MLPEMYKRKHNLSKSCLKDLFSVVNGNYNLRSQSDFGISGVNIVFMVLFFFLCNKSIYLVRAYTTVSYCIFCMQLNNVL